MFANGKCARATDEDVAYVLNKPIEEAKFYCQSKGLICRINVEDNKARIVTADLRLDRISVTVENGIVIDARIVQNGNWF